jgi:hypothetical protein
MKLNIKSRNPKRPMGLKPVYNMDHEVGPCKRPFFNGLMSMVRLLEKLVLKALGPSPNVNQEELPCTKMWMCWFFLIHVQKGEF